jgi:hypothetical protein
MVSRCPGLLQGAQDGVQLDAVLRLLGKPFYGSPRRVVGSQRFKRAGEVSSEKARERLGATMFITGRQVRSRELRESVYEVGGTAGSSVAVHSLGLDP